MKYAYMWATLISMFFSLLAMYEKNTYLSTLNRKYKNLYKLLAFLSFIPLTFISSVRYNIGTDFSAYEAMFIEGGSYIKEQEPGFYYLIQVIKQITENPQVFFAILSIIICGIYYWAIYKESENPMFSILLFLLTREFFDSMNSIRQYTAQAVFMLAIPLIRKGGWRWIFIVPITALAFTLHNSIVALLPLYLLIIFNPAPWLSGFIVIAFYIFPKFAMDFFYKSVTLVTKYGHYLDGLAPALEASTFLSFVCLFGFLMVMVKNISKNDRQTRLFYNALIYGMSALAIAAGTHWAAIRLSYFANPFIVLYLPHIVNKVEKRWLRRFSYVLIFLGFFVVCNYITLSGNQGVLGYTTFWQVAAN